MKKTYENSIEYKALQVINHTKHAAILREDFLHLGSYRQVSRALHRLIEKKKLIRIGLGIYGEAEEFMSHVLLKKDFVTVSRNALDRFNVRWLPGTAESEYNAGLSQQVPVHNFVRLESRFRCKMSHLKLRLYYEGEINAR